MSATWRCRHPGRGTTRQTPHHPPSGAGGAAGTAGQLTSLCWGAAADAEPAGLAQNPGREGFGQQHFSGAGPGQQALGIAARPPVAPPRPPSRPPVPMQPQAHGPSPLQASGLPAGLPQLGQPMEQQQRSQQTGGLPAQLRPGQHSSLPVAPPRPPAVPPSARQSATAQQAAFGHPALPAFAGLQPLRESPASGLGLGLQQPSSAVGRPGSVTSDPAQSLPGGFAGQSSAAWQPSQQRSRAC